MLKNKLKPISRAKRANFHKFLIVSIVFIAILSFFAYTFFKNPNIATATWWNEAWQYRQSILVTNNTSAQNNVYISVTLNTLTASTSMQTDCGDFRFTRENGEVLPYYIVSGCRTATNVIHINFQTFDAGKQAIYFYYGNPSAENGFAASDFATQASNYTIGAIGIAEVGPGPVAYWSFDEGYGTVAHDESGQGNTGTISGATWKNDEECVSSKCLGFDGAGDYVDAGTGASINDLFTDGGTISLWFKINSWSGFDNVDTYLFSRRANPTSAGYYLRISTSTKSVYFYNYFGAQAGIWRLNNKELELNKWTHLELTYSNNSVSNDPIAYINGLVSNVTETQSPAGAAAGGNYNLRIGGVNNSGGYYEFKGFMDEVKIYSYSRTADQVKQDYNTGLSGMKSNTGTSVSFGGSSDKWMSDGLVGYWKFDESATTSGAIDSSGNGNNGVYYGNASTTGGRFGNSSVFNGGDGWVNLGNPAVMNFGSLSSYSINFWVKANDVTPTLKEIISKTDHNGGNQKIHFYLSNGTLYRFSEFSGPNISSNDGWVYISYTYTAIGENYGKETFYKNGSTQWTRTGSMPSYQNVNWNIGGVDTYWNFNGAIDEVRIYNRALSQSEVQKLYEWAPGPVMHLKMDEMSGQDVFNTGVGGFHGTLGSANSVESSDPTWRAGKYGASLLFDGSNDLMEVDYNQALELNDGGGTVSAWIKIDESVTLWQGAAMSILRRSAYSNWDVDGGYTMALYQGGPSDPHRLSVSLGSAWSADRLTGSKTDFENGKWYYVTMQWNENILRTYVNGVEEASMTRTVKFIDAYHTEPFRIGYGPAGWSISYYYYKGLIDDVRIYNYARTQKQILEDMNGGGLAIDSPMVDLSFDEGYGATAHNEGIGGSVLNATLVPGGGGSNDTATKMWNGNGRNSKAIELDGTDDYVSLPDFGY